MNTRLSAILAASAVSLLAAAPTASATNMTPLVTCVEQTDTGYLAHFGYRNDEKSTVSRSIAVETGPYSWPRYRWLNMVFNGAWTNTKAEVGLIDRGQPTTFLPGTHDDVFTVPFTSGTLTWALVGRFAVASAQSPACPTPDPEPEPEPGPDPVVPTVTPPADTPVAPASTPAADTPVPPASTPAKVCTSRRVLTIRLRERKGQKIRSARVIFNKKTIAVSRRTTDGRVIAKIDFRKLPSGRFSVQIRAKLTNGKTRTYTRKYYTCKPKLGPANKLGSKTAL